MLLGPKQHLADAAFVFGMTKMVPHTASRCWRKAITLTAKIRPRFVHLHIGTVRALKCEAVMTGS